MRKTSALVAVVVLSALAVVVLACRSRNAGPGSSVLEAAVEGAEAEIETKLAVDLQELSGLAHPPGSRAARQIYAIGDRKKHLVRMTFGDRHDEPEVEIVNLKDLFPSGDSQWEAVAVDMQGVVYIMRESPAAVFAVDPATPRILQTINLDFGQLAGAADADGENSLGEGMILMKNGHILVMKEKGPSLLLEFGPLGQPLGVTPDTVLGSAPFAPPPGAEVTYRVLKSWEIGDNAQQLMRDFSDLAVGDDGIYALSDRSGRIAKLRFENKVKVDRYWDLPNDIEKPEGLAFFDGRPVVGSDKVGGKNVYVLERLGD
jgi:hypothetical protein